MVLTKMENSNKVMIDENNNQKMSEFEELLNQYDYSNPKQGDVIEGEIQMIDDDSIILDVGLKRPAQVLSKEVRNMDNESMQKLSVGDVIQIYVTNKPVGDEALLVSINKTIEHRNWIQAEELVKQDHEIALEVTGMNRGGLLVKFEYLEGFIPNSHIPEIAHQHDNENIINLKQEMIGSKINVKPIEVDKENNKLVFSARLIDDEQRKKRLKEISVGDVITGEVTNIVAFGAFIDLGGIDGLIHVSELSWKRITHPSSVVSLGEEISVIVKDVNIKKERVSLSRKDLLPNPWDEFSKNHGVGDTVDAEVTDIVDFGAFARLIDGVQGLIHVSELGYTEPEDLAHVVEPGEVVRVKVLSIDAERQRVSLSMREVPREDQLKWISGE